MKSVIVIQVIIMCLLLTIFSIFTIDGANVKKAELQQIVACDVTDIVDAYFNGEVSGEQLEGKIKSAILDSAHSTMQKLSVFVDYADSSKGVLSLAIEETYRQPNGSYRTISAQKVYIREKPGSPDASAYFFTRNINEEYYKNNAGSFVPESDGGLKADSIWRTPEYSLVLDVIFAN